MTAKRSWVHISHKELKTTRKKNEAIQWTSSSSDEDEVYYPSRPNDKKCVCDETSIQVHNSYCTPPPETSDLKTTQFISTTPSPIKMDPQIDESPIIGGSLILGDESPILNRIPPYKLSPIIGRRQSLRPTRRIKRSFERANDDNEVSFPSLSQSSRFIDNSSQTVEVEDYSSIDPFPSQNSSEVMKIQSPSSEFTPSTISSLTSVNKLIRKKRYKTGGLASRLNRALRNYKSRLAIRDHEMHKNKNLQLSQSDEIVQFKIISKWEEFGSLICKAISLDQEILIVVGFNLNISEVELEIGNGYKVLPPYSSKIVECNNKDIICYFNISKIIYS